MKPGQPNLRLSNLVQSNSTHFTSSIICVSARAKPDIVEDTAEESPGSGADQASAPVLPEKEGVTSDK